MSNASARICEFLSDRSRHAALVIVLAALAYLNSFSVPFQASDTAFIIENPFVTRIDLFFEPGAERGHPLYGPYLRRPVGYFTFAVNHLVHEGSVFGYHAANLAVHAANALLAMAFMGLLLRTPLVSASGLDETAKAMVRFFTGAAFAVHPLQSAAVTGVYERFVLLAAMFSLLSVFLYTRGRLESGVVSKTAHYICALVSAALAMKSRESALALPALLLLAEIVFFPGTFREQAVRVLPFCLTLPLIFIGLGVLRAEEGGILGGAFDLARVESGRTPSEYLLAQGGALLTYARLAIMPVGQKFVYVASKTSGAGAALGFAIHAAVIACAVTLVARARRGRGDPAMGIIGFGMLWFYLALLPDSSVYPQREGVAEQRAYLSLFGALAAVFTGAFVLAAKGKRRDMMVPIAALALVLLAGATLARNQAWKRLSPGDAPSVSLPRGDADEYLALGLRLKDSGEHERAIESFVKALAADPDSPRAHYNLAVEYERLGRFDDARRHYERTIELDPMLAEAYNNAAIIYLRDERPESAEAALGLLKKAIEIRPDYISAHNNLGLVYRARRMNAEAEAEFRAALALDEGNAEAHNNLGVLYGSIKAYSNAIAHIERAIASGGDKPKYLNNLGIVYYYKGDAPKAVELFERAIALRPDYEKARRNLDMVQRKLKGQPPRPN